MKGQEPLKEVHAFWNTEACGTHFVPDFDGEKDFFEKFREYRYRTEWHIPILVPFAEAKGKSVLEIGIGNGADAVMFAKNGGAYTGADLTEAALDATRRHFEVMGLEGKFLKENAEAMTFPDETFDMVYSHGVLHHTKNTATAIGEVHRVLKKGGKAIIMLYHRHSFNYYVRIMLYMRARLLLKIFSRLGRWGKDRERLEEEGRTGLRGNESDQVWEIHYRNFLRRGWEYLKPSNFVHHCTDGPECPIAYAFTSAEAKELFSQFEGVHTRVAHFPIRKYTRWIPFWLEKFLAARMGWYLFIFGTKRG